MMTPSLTHRRWPVRENMHFQTSDPLFCYQRALSTSLRCTWTTFIAFVNANHHRQ